MPKIRYRAFITGMIGDIRLRLHTVFSNLFNLQHEQGESIIVHLDVIDTLKNKISAKLS